MSVTYPADPAKPYGDRVEAPLADMTHDEPFVPVYARRGKARGGQGKIRTWMILTPIAVLALGGIGAMMVMNGSDEPSAPLAEPAATGPVLPIAATATAPAATTMTPLTTASTPEPVVAAPVGRDATPLRRIAPAPTPAPAPARREAVRAPAPAATPRVVTPTPTGPQPYTPAPAAPSTSTLNRAPATPAATPAPAPTPPVIIVEPVG
ncbi:hypothetical protein [Brevundimonas sp.]|uniref:hypothetical protein n=1 Tax=Brevundimonas sp. TaxID=1871086 RepID=UPI0027316F22|nr:hypothetical protein [Brevundimonas sp.]MDP1913241.1 hypothetical protein [Brevundimonas sp.]